MKSVPAIENGLSHAWLTTQSDSIKALNEYGLPTPIRTKRLRKLLFGYDSTLKKFLIKGLKRGFQIGEDELKGDMHAKNSPTVFQAPEHAREKIEQ